MSKQLSGEAHDTLPPPSPFKCNTWDPMNNHDMHTMSFEDHEEHGNNTMSPKPKSNMIKPLRLDFLEQTSGGWTKEVEKSTTKVTG